MRSGTQVGDGHVYVAGSNLVAIQNSAQTCVLTSMPKGAGKLQDTKDPCQTCHVCFAALRVKKDLSADYSSRKERCERVCFCSVLSCRCLFHIGVLLANTNPVQK